MLSVYFNVSSEIPHLELDLFTLDVFCIMTLKVILGSQILVFVELPSKEHSPKSLYAFSGRIGSCLHSDLGWWWMSTVLVLVSFETLSGFRRRQG